MQFHLNGFHPGDPDVFAPAASGVARSTELPETVDVLIVGCGPAGLTLAAQLSAFPHISTCIVEQKAGPMAKGQADGISCRSMEMFQAFGIAEKIKREAYWVNETTFWNPDPKNPERIRRTGRIQDVEDGLSEMPHVILNQARVHDRYLEIMRNSPARMEPFYARKVIDLTIEETDASHPVTVTIERSDEGGEGKIETVRARYAVGCDGARSKVRRAIGQELRGDRANQAWGVMDVLAVTDFPDIRLKSLIKSEGEGSIVIIPREGGHLVRIYIEMDKLDDGQHVTVNDVTVKDLIAATNRVLRPYSIDVKDVAWWSIYEVGHSLADKFDNVSGDDLAGKSPRVFIAGDACHTHSAKAGQGMNVSMGDTFNLGWKLISVLEGRSAPDVLHTYAAERHGVAKDLIDFDHEWSRLIGAPPESGASLEATPKFQEYFVEHGRYTAGLSVKYAPSIYTGNSEWQHLAKGFEIGTRFHSAPVVRLGDAKAMELGHTIEADARWRIYAFCPDEDLSAKGAAIGALSNFLAHDPNSPVLKYTPSNADPDSVIDVRAVFQQEHRSLAFEVLPAFFRPAKGKFGLTDYEKMFSPDFHNGRDIFEMRGVNRQKGCLLIVRPDQYVAHILPFDAHESLSKFFDGFMLQL